MWHLWIPVDLSPYLTSPYGIVPKCTTGPIPKCYYCWVVLRKESCLAESGYPPPLSRIQDEVESLSVPKNADDLWFNKVSYITIFVGRKGKTPKQKTLNRTPAFLMFFGYIFQFLLVLNEAFVFISFKVFMGSVLQFLARNALFDDNDEMFFFSVHGSRQKARIENKRLQFFWFFKSSLLLKLNWRKRTDWVRFWQL